MSCIVDTRVETYSLDGLELFTESQEGSVSEIVLVACSVAPSRRRIIGEHDLLWCLVFGAAIALKK